MTKKLLNKTTRSFLLLSVLILMVSAPIFYYVSHWLYVYETDEILTYHKNAFVKDDIDKFNEADLLVWNKYNRDAEIVPDTGIKRDSIFGTVYFDSIADEYEPFRELWAPIEIDGKRYTYIERNNLVEMEDMVYAVAFMFLFIIILLLTGIILLSGRLAKNIWSPFYDTLRRIQNFEIDKNKPPQFVPTDIEEFDSLNQSIEKLIEKNTIIYNSQREFIENAAHELQTPLTLFQTKIDTLSQSAALSKEQTQLISSMNNDVARMNRLNKNLLLLSKIDNDIYFEKQPVVLNDIIRKYLEFFTEQANAKSVAIVVNDDEKAEVYTNSVLAGVLANNLFMNAIRHNIPNGKIIITTTRDSITFSNTGQESSLNASKLFNRFSKAGASSQGNGLGLAIVKKICGLNQWSISYGFENGLHSFRIIFK